MSENIEFEIQVETPKSRHGWRAIGDRRTGFFTVNEDTRIPIRLRTVEQARQSIEMLRTLYYEPAYLMMPKHRIVKITVVTTYDVVE